MTDKDDPNERNASSDEDRSRRPQASESEGEPTRKATGKTGENVVTVNFGALPQGRSLPPDPSDETKLRAFIDLIEKGMVGVTLDARVEGVEVPLGFRHEHQLVLNFSHKFFLDDFAFDDRGVRASLSFQGRDHFVDIPWRAIWMMHSHEDGTTIVSPDDIPVEITSDVSRPKLQSLDGGHTGKHSMDEEKADGALSIQSLERREERLDKGLLEAVPAGGDDSESSSTVPRQGLRLVRPDDEEPIS